MDIHGEGGGGGGGGGHTPIEANDTLQSRQIVRLLLAVSEGEIDAVEDILLNNVSISQYSATWEWRPGIVGQKVIEGFVNTESPVASFSPVNIASGTEYFATLAYTASACRITLTLNALKMFNSNNDTVGYSVSYVVYSRPSASSVWSLVTTITKRGKASSAYSWDTLIPAPAGVTPASNWEIKLIRTTPDDDGKHFSASSWSAATEITNSNLSYDNTALVGITLTDAKQFGGNIPKITFKLRGIKVKVPTNYNPITHTYNESVPWDGSLTENLFHYTANPAWHIYNILNNSRYGLNIAKSDIDVVSLYELSKYCDELVDNGKGGQERRYELHNQFYTREDPSTFLMYLLTICNANFTNNEFGQISIMYDRPNQPITKQVTNANVIDGEFTYSSGELNSRYNLVNVTYNRKEFNGKTDTATETEPSLITRYGLQSTDIVLAGCTSEAQAIRKARWAIYTNSYLPNSISFKTLFAGLTYHVGELVRIFDNDNQGSQQGGLIKSSSQTASDTILTVDRQLTLGNSPYTVTFLGLDGITEKTYPIQETNGNFNTLTFTGLETPAVNSPFIIEGAINSRIFKVVKVTKSEDTYEVLSIEHSEAKYSYIDNAVILPNPSGDFINVSEYTTTPVTNVTVVENFSSNGVVQHSSLEVSWDWIKGTAKYAADFALEWERDSQNSVFVESISGTTYDIPNPVPGVYTITIWAVNPFSGIKSAPVTQVYSFRTTSGTSSLLPPENVFVAGTTGTAFTTQDLHLTFTYPIANNSVSDTLLDYVVEVWDTSILNLKGTYTVSPNTDLGGSFSFAFTENADRFGTPARQFTIKVFSRDVIGDLSLPAQVTVNNAVPAAPSFSIISGTEAAYLSITPSSDIDIAGYESHRSTTSGFTPSPSTLVADGPGTYISLKGVETTQYFYRIGAYDTFGKVGMVYGPEQSSTMLSGNKVPVWVFDGLIFKPNDPSPNLVSWAAGSASLNGGAPIPINAGNSTTAWTSGIQYFYYDGSSNTISVTTSLAVAVTGAMVLATYKGGTNLVVGNGDAYVDGNLILANTVGANQLVSNNAVITNTAQVANAVIGSTHIQDGAITNAKIGSYIQSTNYDATHGWNIDKSGSATFNNILIRDPNGTVILQSGSGVNWNAVTGPGRPQNGADVTSQNTALNIAGQGAFATLNQINSSNVSTYIANLAVGNAQIADLAVNNAKIVDLAVNTLKIQDESVTVSRLYHSGQVNLSMPVGSRGRWYIVQTLVIPSTTAPVFAFFETTGSFSNYYQTQITTPFRLRTNTGQISTTALDSGSGIYGTTMFSDPSGISTIYFEVMGDTASYLDYYSIYNPKIGIIYGIK